MGVAEFKVQLEMALKKPGPVPVPPPWLYVWFHWDFLKAIEAGDLSEAKIKELSDRSSTMFDTILARGRSDKPPAGGGQQKA